MLVYQRAICIEIFWLCCDLFWHLNRAPKGFQPGNLGQASFQPVHIVWGHRVSINSRIYIISLYLNFIFWSFIYVLHHTIYIKIFRWPETNKSHLALQPKRPGFDPCPPRVFRWSRAVWTWHPRPSGTWRFSDRRIVMGIETTGIVDSLWVILRARSVHRQYYIWPVRIHLCRLCISSYLICDFKPNFK